MSNLIAIHGGGDWADASADYLIMPEGISVSDEREKWSSLYKNDYLPGKNDLPYMTFPEWLIKSGAKKATPEEITIYDFT